MNFTTVRIWIESDRPMLQHRATEEALSGRTRSNSPGSEEDPRDVCERTVYRLTNKQLAVPGAAFARMLREAGSSHKSKGSRKSLKYIVPAAVIITDDLCPLFLHDRKTPLVDYEVDSRPVTIPATKGRIMRHRARFNEWSCLVNVRINEQILDEPTIRRLMVEGMVQVGIGDFRPEKGGPFGIGSVVAWEVTTDAKTTPARLRNGDKRIAA